MCSCHAKINSESVRAHPRLPALCPPRGCARTPGFWGALPSLGTVPVVTGGHKKWWPAWSLNHPHQQNLPSLCWERWGCSRLSDFHSPKMSCRQVSPPQSRGLHPKVTTRRLKQCSHPSRSSLGSPFFLFQYFCTTQFLSLDKKPVLRLFYLSMPKGL